MKHPKKKVRAKVFRKSSLNNRKIPSVLMHTKENRTGKTSAKISLKMSSKQQEMVKKIISLRGSEPIHRTELEAISTRLYGKSFALDWIRKWGKSNRGVGRGMYSLQYLKDIIEQHGGVTPNEEVA